MTTSVNKPGERRPVRRPIWRSWWPFGLAAVILGLVHDPSVPFGVFGEPLLPPLAVCAWVIARHDWSS